MVKLVDLVKEALKIPSNRNLSGGGGGSGDNEPKRKSKRHRVSGSEEGKDPTLALLDYCLENPSGYDSVWFYLSSELSEKNASKKLQALLIIDSLFHNSPHFRKVVNESMDSLLQHTGILSSSGGSSSRACISHNSVFQKGIELIALWDFLYGTELGKVHILARYIKESLGLQLPNISVQLEELRRQRQERERTHKQKVFLRAQQIRELDLPGLLKTCSETMDTIDQCFNILFPNPLVNEGDENAEAEDRNGTGEDDDDIRWEVDDNVGGDGGNSLAAVVRSAAPFTLELNIATTVSDLKTADNEVLLSCIEDGAAQLAKSLIPRLVALQKDIMSARSYYQEELSNLDLNMNILNLARLQGKLQGKLHVEENALNDIQICLGRAKELLTNRCKSLLS